jgi:curved DNA-binding protein CbpA
MRLCEASKADERVPRLAAGCDPTALSLTPADGYLLSRIDGHTPWNVLRAIGGLSADDVDRRLEAWLEAGVIEVEGASSPPPKPEAPAAGGLDLQVDPTLDLDDAVQREVIAFASQLDRPYHEILGVARDADERAIKKAYFALSKRFHPDRYFRRNLGPFGPVLERCFRRLLEAYELLSDPITRQEVERDLTERASAASFRDAKESRASAAAASRRLRERARQLGGRQQLLFDRRRKAKGFFESGMAAFAKQRWLEAAGSVRLAIAFDPSNEAYRDRFAEVQRRAHEERAKTLVLQAERALEVRDYLEALSLLEEASHFRPYDADLHHRAANLAWQVESDLKRAKTLAQTACEIEPENARYRRTLGQIYAAAGLASNARRELTAALRLDPQDHEARVALKSL